MHTILLPGGNKGFVIQAYRVNAIMAGRIVSPLSLRLYNNLKEDKYLAPPDGPGFA